MRRVTAPRQPPMNPAARRKAEGLPPKPAPSSLDPKVQQEELEELASNTAAFAKVLAASGLGDWMVSHEMAMGPPWQVWRTCREAIYEKVYDELCRRYPYANRAHVSSSSRVSVEGVAMEIARLSTAVETVALFPYGSAHNHHFNPPQKG